MNALASTGSWPVDNVAAAAFGPDRAVLSYGDITVPFQLASLTKLFSSLAVFVAVEEGSVALDDSVGPPGATLSDLLGHASGYGFDTDEVLAEPGTRRIYSNTGIDRAAEHVSASTGMAFGDYLREAVFEPLGMASTTLRDRPSAGAWGSVNDLVRFIKGVLDHVLISPGTTALMTSPYRPELDGVLPGFGSQHPNPWGLGYEVKGTKSPHWTSPSNSSATWGHFGGAGTFLWHDPAVDATLIALTDRPFGDWAFEPWPTLATAVLADLV